MSPQKACQVNVSFACADAGMSSGEGMQPAAQHPWPSDTTDSAGQAGLLDKPDKGADTEHPAVYSQAEVLGAGTPAIQPHQSMLQVRYCAPKGNFDNLTDDMFVLM